MLDLPKLLYQEHDKLWSPEMETTLHIPTLMEASNGPRELPPIGLIELSLWEVDGVQNH